MNQAPAWNQPPANRVRVGDDPGVRPIDTFVFKYDDGPDHTCNGAASLAVAIQRLSAVPAGTRKDRLIATLTSTEPHFVITGGGHMLNGKVRLTRRAAALPEARPAPAYTQQGATQWTGMTARQQRIAAAQQADAAVQQRQEARTTRANLLITIRENTEREARERNQAAQGEEGQAEEGQQ